MLDYLAYGVLPDLGYLALLAAAVSIYLASLVAARAAQRERFERRDPTIRSRHVVVHEHFSAAARRRRSKGQPR